MRNSFTVMLLAWSLALPAVAAAQPGVGSGGLREVALLAGAGSLSHGDDRLGWGSTVGGAVTIPIVERLAVRLEAHRAFGPDPQERSCNIVNVSCSGVGHYGARDLTIWAGNAVYHFGRTGVRPYVLGGVNVLHFRFLSDVTTIRNGQATITEFEEDYTTMGIGVGAGLRVPIGRQISIAPEFMIHDGTILAGANLTQARTSVAIGYRW